MGPAHLTYHMENLLSCSTKRAYWYGLFICNECSKCCLIGFVRTANWYGNVCISYHDQHIRNPVRLLLFYEIKQSWVFPCKFLKRRRTVSDSINMDSSIAYSRVR